MLNVFLSVLPIFLLIIAGYAAKNYFMPEEVFWKAADKLVYYIFFHHFCYWMSVRRTLPARIPRHRSWRLLAELYW
jgi:hypothetical protein